MIRLLGSLPNAVTVAVSGGVDSMAIADFIGRTRSIRCAFFHHGTQTSEHAQEVVRQYCKERGWDLIESRISTDRPFDCSPEEHWRNQRYNFLDSLDCDVITGHHLDDCVETYLWSVIHGTAKVIPYRRNRVIRPFLLTKKTELISWAERNNVPWLEDFTNKDTKYTRNYIREHVVPHAFEVNPGLHKMVAKKVKIRAKID